MLKTTLLTLTLMLTLAGAFAQPAVYQDVQRVVDADSLIVTVGDKAERVRLIGIDAPETWRKPEPFGAEATAFIKELLAGQKVRLEYGPQLRDQYGRLLAHVFLPDGRDVSLLLAQNGLARLDVREPNTARAELYEAAVAGARSVKKGMWAESPGKFVDRNCPSFATQELAQVFYDAASTTGSRDPHRLDVDGNELACQRLPSGPLLFGEPPN